MLLLLGGAALRSERIEASDNYTGGISVRRRLNERVDLGLGYSGIASAGNNQNFSSPSPATTFLFLPGLITNPVVVPPGGLNVSARTTATHHIADLDLGYLLTLSSVSTLKVIGGVRFVQFEQNTDMSLSNAVLPGPGIFSHRREDNFIGAGPRLGAKFFHDIGNGFGINAGLNGSILAGEQRVHTTTTSAVEARKANQSHGRVVYNAGAEVSLERKWTENLSASVGYQASAWFGLRDNSREVSAAATIAAGCAGACYFGGGEQRPIDLYHGPFLSVRYRH